jgi:hypothetical protein
MHVRNELAPCVAISSADAGGRFVDDIAEGVVADVVDDRAVDVRNIADRA